MDGVEPEHQGVVRYAFDLLSTVNRANALGLAPLPLSDFSFYDFDLVSYLQSELRRTSVPRKG
jgi:hypothetical protein